MPALGERFRAAREARGLSLSDAAEQIRIRSVYLAAIEDENWNAIGAPVYVRGFLRTYARFLNLEPEEAVAAFNATMPPPSPGTPATPSSASYRPDQPSPVLSPLTWAAAAVAIALIAFVVFNALTMRQRAAVVALAPSPGFATAAPSAQPARDIPSRAQTASAPRQPTEDRSKSLELRFVAPSWVRVVVDGNVSMVGTFPAGTAKLFHGTNALLRVGNAGGVEIFVDGKSRGKLGPSGDVVERSFTL
jgi:cytoskeleton protein RodZ